MPTFAVAVTETQTQEGHSQLETEPGEELMCLGFLVRTGNTEEVTSLTFRRLRSSEAWPDQQATYMTLSGRSDAH